MATNRLGWVDSYQSSRLLHAQGTTYPAAPTNVYLALFSGKMPVSDGTGGTEVSPATRPTITFGSVVQDANGRHYQTNSAAITGIVLTNTSPGDIVGFGICTGTSGANVIYSDHLPQPFHVSAGQTVSIAAGAIRMFTEPPLI